jgi:RNA polymerase sigma-70 factor (ECF subfamily)
MMTSITTDAACSRDTQVERKKNQERELSESESQRLRKARSLDRNTISAIYDEYHQPVYSYIYRRVGDVETARDLTAEVFRRFLQALHNGTGPSENLRAWLYRVAHNIVIDHYRRQQNQRHYRLEENWIGVEGDPGIMAEQHIQAEEVRVALSHLTPDQQQVVTLKFLEGMSNKEVAKITGKPIGAVKSLQHRALAALQRQLAPAEEETLA